MVPLQLQHTGIPCCCSSCVGFNYGLDLIPSLGTPYATMPQSSQKRKNNNKTNYKHKLCLIINLFFQVIKEIFFFFFFLFSASGAVTPGLGGQIRAAATYATATATATATCSICDLHHSSQQLWILNPLSKTRDKTCILEFPSWRSG